MNDKTTPAKERDTVTAEVSRSMAATPERVFDAWLDPGLRRVWGELSLRRHGLPGEVMRVEIEPHEGGRFVLSDRRDGEEALHWGSHLVVDRPHRLVFTWFTSEEEELEDLSTVTLEIEAEGAGSKATMRHEMSARWAAYVKQTAEAWGYMLAAVDAVLSEPLGEVVDANTLRIERRLPGPVERVWSYLVESERRRRWLASGEVEPRVGGRIVSLFRHHEISPEPTPASHAADSSGPPAIGTVTAWEPLRRLAYTWDDQVSEVSFELFPDGEEVRLVLTHRRLPSRKSMVGTATGWHAHLSVLLDELRGQAHRGFWTEFASVGPSYEERLRLEAPEHAIVIHRELDAPLQTAYSAWTEPRLMRLWLGSKVEADVRVGGHYRIENDGGDGQTFVHQGRYLRIEEGRRVTQSFGAGPAGGPSEDSPYLDEFIDARFNELGPSRTELLFTNGWDGQGMSEEEAEATRAAWSAWLDQMEASLPKGP